MAFFKTIFKSIGKALDWISGEDERLRAARARGQGAGEVEAKNVEDSREENDRRNEEKRFADEYDVWEEIDSYRTTFWFGSKVGRMMSRSRKQGEKLEKELDELERKREIEKEKKEGKA
jgi:hypothetical protein